MSRYLLDTNIISNVTKLTPSEALLDWMGEQVDEKLFIASLTVVGQVLIVSFGGVVFSVEPLGAIDWLAIAGATASVLLFAEAARRIRMTIR